MKNKIKHIEDLTRDNRAEYRVPDGYFAELNRAIIDKSEETVVSGSGAWTTIRSMLSFSASFAAMVILAITGYYFTGYQAKLSQSDDESFYMISLYGVTTEDIIQSQQDNSEQSSLFEESAIAYLTEYGYDITEITE